MIGGDVPAHPRAPARTGGPCRSVAPVAVARTTGVRIPDALLDVVAGRADPGHAARGGGRTPAPPATARDGRLRRAPRRPGRRPAGLSSRSRWSPVRRAARELPQLWHLASPGGFTAAVRPTRRRHRVADWRTSAMAVAPRPGPEWPSSRPRPAGSPPPSPAATRPAGCRAARRPRPRCTLGARRDAEQHAGQRGQQLRGGQPGDRLTRRGPQRPHRGREAPRVQHRRPRREDRVGRGEHGHRDVMTSRTSLTLAWPGSGGPVHGPPCRPSRPTVAW